MSAQTVSDIINVTFGWSFTIMLLCFCFFALAALWKWFFVICGKVFLWLFPNWYKNYRNQLNSKRNK